MAKKTQKFPKTIYVTREGEGNDAYWSITLPDDLDGVDQSTVVGVYDLSGTGIVRVNRDFTWK